MSIPPNFRHGSRRVRFAALILTLAPAAACSALVDADRFRSSGAGLGPDAAGSERRAPDVGPPDGSPADDASVGDVDARADAGTPPVPEIRPVEPLFEGQRAIYRYEGLSPRIGDELVASSTTVEVEAFTRADDGVSGAFVVVARVDERLRAGERRDVRIVLRRQGAEVAELGTLRVDGLDEARLEGEVATTELAQLYSRVEIPFTGVRFVGPIIARVRATSSIEIAGPVDASAGLAPAAGPGGGAGGGSSADGLGPAPGGGGGNAPCPGPGAGGSNRTRGEDARGDLGGTAAEALTAATTSLFSLVGSGGGGGGADAPDPGQPGGGGGGGVVFESLGELLWTGGVAARGGDGVDSARPGCGQTFGAASGGGSGGLVVVRSATSIASSGAVDVAGGAGGDDGDKAGGAGGDGWAFVAAPGALIGPAATATRLPAWDLPSPPVVDADVDETLVLWAEPDHSVRITVNGGAARVVTPDATGRAEWLQTLPVGVVELCAVDLDAPVETCVRVVALP